MTKIFCDIADKKLIKKFDKKKIVKGFTTNPSLIRKAGAKNYSQYCKDILKITKKPISFEVFADENRNIINQCIEPDVGDVFFIKGEGDAPWKSRFWTRDAKVFQGVFQKT